MRTPTFLLLATTLVSAFAIPDAMAADPSANYEDSDGEWHYRVAPYLWATGMSGELGLGDSSPVNALDASFSDILSNLDMAGMVFMDARRDRWGVAADFFYAKLSKDTDAYVDQGYGTLDAETRNKIVHLAATYRLSSTDTGNFDLIGGIRYADVNTTLEVDPGPSLPSGGRATDSQNWVDGFVGVKGAGEISDRWALFGQLDVGAGGTDLSWQAIAGARYRLESGNGVDFGYRFLSQDYSSNDFTYDIQMGGAFVGMSFVF